MTVIFYWILPRQFNDWLNFVPKFMYIWRCMYNCTYIVHLRWLLLYCQALEFIVWALHALIYPMPFLCLCPVCKNVETPPPTHTHTRTQKGALVFQIFLPLLLSLELIDFEGSKFLRQKLLEQLIILAVCVCVCANILPLPLPLI